MILPVVATPSPQEILAQREVERYVYLRTGRLLPKGTIVVARKDHAPYGRNLKPQEYLLKTVGRRLYVVGGDDAGTLYGAYRLAEKIGVRFYLHGDVVPDRRIPFRLPKLNEVGRPLFRLRGIQPFHDFPEGPDWWSRDDYLSVIAQLPKMGMNFVGFHTYPEGGAGPEPLVWIGLRRDLNPDGLVRFSYPAQWAHTLRSGAWGYAASRTSDFSGGASQLFPTDDYGFALADPFREAGSILHDAFAEARTLGVKTCVGTETPLTVPTKVRERMQALGMDAKNVQPLYEGIFDRIRRLYPADYYWLWTPEDWTWSGNTPDQFRRTTDDILAAYRSLPKGMRLATSGWVLGPQGDRAALDRALPKDVAVSAINQQVGHAAVDPAFARVNGRNKWAIPWMENDPSLSAPQLWAGRMRYDAADALRMGCDGLLGIHWRTKVLAPTISALASAGWDQSWRPKSFGLIKAPTDGAVGGNVAEFSEPVANTDEQPVYQTVRYGMSGYDLRMPNGRFTVTLKFNEPFYDAPNKRVFAVKLQGRTVIDRLDIFAKVGKNHALDYTFRDVSVKVGRLRVDFVPIVEYPAIAGIVAGGRKIDCGGRGYRGYTADDLDNGAIARKRTMPVTDFYEDFARANFDLPEAGRIFARIDGVGLPEPAGWIDGPGGIKIQKMSVRDYGFVDEFARLRAKVKGSGNQERFDYWLNTFRYMRAMAELGSLRADLDREMASKRPAGTALQTRIAMRRVWDRMLSYAMRTVSTPGELGTIANLQQHVLRQQKILSAHDDELAKLLGRPLPRTAEPGSTYAGPSRIIVPTVRTLASPGEVIAIETILLGPSSATLRWREMGRGAFHSLPLHHVARGVYRARLAIPPTSRTLEYYIESGALRFPSTAPSLNQTVVTFPVAGR